MLGEKAEFFYKLGEHVRILSAHDRVGFRNYLNLISFSVDEKRAVLGEHRPVKAFVVI